jgi:hypothetical protein
MAADDFFARWSKKSNDAQQQSVEDIAAPSVPAHDVVAPAPEAALAPLTLEDAARLTPDADFSAFMARGVDEVVKRAAMKKLFSDPHFNIMDGLDTYIDDYNKFEALTPDIVATLNHAKSLLDPLSQCATPPMRLLDALDEEGDSLLIAPSDAPVEISSDAPHVDTEADAEAPQHVDSEQAEPIVNTTRPFPD